MTLYTSGSYSDCVTTTHIEPLSVDSDPLGRIIEYVRNHTVAGTMEQAGPPNVIDMHFFRVRIKSSFNIEYFRYLFRLFVKAGHGAFGDTVDIDRIKGGPSYIEWGAWIGDQGMAMTVMAAGAYAGLWEVVTPATLHITGAEADELAGRGFIMTTGLKDD